VCHPPRNNPDLFVTLLIELLGERVRERDQVDGSGGRRSTRSGGGCHTGDVKTAASATGTQGACDAASGALADKMPLRQTSGGDRTGPDAGGCHQAEATGTARQGLPHARRVVSPLNAVWQAGAGAGMACAARAVSVSPWPCVVWQPSTRSGAAATGG